MNVRVITLIFIFAVIFPFFFSNWGLTESSEARYAEISREMFVNGEYVHPKLLGINHYHKPPVTYYITAIGYFIFGVNEYGVRFFPAVAFLFQLLFIYKIANLLFRNNSLSLAAVLLYFSYPIAQVAAKNLTTDCFLATFIFASIYFYLKSRQPLNNIKYVYLFYIFCGLAFLTKGPVGILPSAVFAICHTRLLKIKRRFAIHHLIALLTGIFICLSWFLILLNNNERLLNYFVNYQLIHRVSGDSFERSKPFWYYFVTIPLFGLPVIYYLVDYFRDGFRRRALSTSRNKILAVTLIICFLVFSLSTSKLVLYVLPMYLFIALLSAWHLSVVPEKRLRLFKNISLLFSLLIFTALIIATSIRISFNFPMLPVTIFSVLGIICVLLCRFQNITPSYIVAPLISAVGMVFLSLIIPAVMKANELESHSIRPLAIFIKEKLISEKASVVIYDQMLPSLAFYTNKNIITLENNNPRINRETQFEQNDNWQSNYIRVHEEKGRQSLQDIAILQNFCIITKTNNPLPDSLSFLKKGLTKQATLGDWILYY